VKCPCFSGEEYAVCCAPYHEGRWAETPLKLMRSRYAAYALRKVDYIIETTATALQKEHRPLTRWKQEIAQFSDTVSFDGLTIASAEDSFVTFTARLSQNGNDRSFTEKSRFEEENGRWVYAGAQPNSE